MTIGVKALDYLNPTTVAFMTPVATAAALKDSAKAKELLVIKTTGAVIRGYPKKVTAENLHYNAAEARVTVEFEQPV